jgi:metal-responsive CopG/Arc/MetJ family transcriptional regulator
VGDFMGRKPLPKGERREVISISLKPATLEAIERMKGMKTRSKWFEEMVEHLLPIHDGINKHTPQKTYLFYCDSCDKQQRPSKHEIMEGTAMCKNPICDKYFLEENYVLEVVE